LKGQGLAAGGRDFCRQLLRHRLLGGIINHDGGTIVTEAFGNCPANSPRGTGNQGDFSFEKIVHGRIITAAWGMGKFPGQRIFNQKTNPHAGSLTRRGLDGKFSE